MPRSIDPADQLIVEVFVRDMERSKEFYRRLGFTLVEDRGEFVELGWGSHRLYLDHKPDLPPAREARVNLRIMVADVNELWRRVQDVGAPVFSAIDDRDYGLRDFIILDPDGFGLRFAAWLR